MVKSVSHLHSAEWKSKRKHSNNDRRKELAHLRAELKKEEEQKAKEAEGKKE